MVMHSRPAFEAPVLDRYLQRVGNNACLLTLQLRPRAESFPYTTDILLDPVTDVGDRSDAGKGTSLSLDTWSTRIDGTTGMGVYVLGSGAAREEGSRSLDPFRG